MNKLKEAIQKYIEIFKKNPKYLILLAVVLLGIVLSLSFFESKQETVLSSATTDADKYKLAIEQQLTEQISTVIKGEVNVMITLENGVEYVYASENKNNQKSVEDSESTDRQKVQKDEQNEDNFIIYKDNNGNEVPLVITEIMPNIKGVVVSCQNGENHLIQAKIKDLVKTALDITDDKVCVVGVDIN